MKFLKQLLEDQPEVNKRGTAINLPADVVKAFSDVGDTQRGLPERAMLNIQNFHHGVLFTVVEHVGDLTHRMSHDVQYGDAGQEFVKEKTGRTIRLLSDPYFLRSHEQNIRNNVEYNKANDIQYREKLNKLLHLYAVAHAMIPVYNKAQWVAREAAIQVGEQNFSTALGYLEWLDRQASKSPGEWTRIAFEYHRDANGKLLQYKHPV